MKKTFATLNNYFDLESFSDYVWFYGFIAVAGIGFLVCLTAWQQLMNI